MKKIMNIPLLVCVLAVSCTALCSCESEEPLSIEEYVGLPHGAEELVAHLNLWEDDDLYEHANGRGSMETESWVSLHLRLIREDGHDAVWVESERRYVLQPGEGANE